MRAPCERWAGPWPWLRPLAVRHVETFAGRTRPRHRDVIRFLLNDSGFQGARAKYRQQPSVAEWLDGPPRMRAARGWKVPVIETVGDLAAWLSLSDDELEWFADLKEPGNRLAIAKHQHYHYSIRAKRSGGVRLNLPAIGLDKLTAFAPKL